MIKKSLLSVTALSAVLLTTNANAGVRIGAGFGLPVGYNINAGYRFNESENAMLKRIGLRLDYNFIDTDKDFEVDGEDYSAAIDNKALGLLLDFHPFGDTFFLGGLRLTGGYYFSSEINVKGRNTKDEIKIGETTYKLEKEEWIEAELDWDISGLYAGFGWDVGLFAGLKFSIDGGVIFTDKPEVNISSSKDVVLQDEDVKKEIDNIKSDNDMVPMIKVSLSYLF
jgi:hypothetical protein